MPAINETFVEIRAELDGLRKDLNKANKMIGGIGKGVSVTKIATSITGLVSALNLVGMAAKALFAPFKLAFKLISNAASVAAKIITSVFKGVKAVLSGIASGIKSTFVAAKTYMTGAVNVAKDFGEQMSAVGALTSTVGTKDFEVLREKALALGRSTEFSATQAAMAMANFARTGQDTSQILQVMAPTLDFATANFLDLNQASDIAARVMGGMKLSASEARRAMDALTIGANKSNQNVSDLAEALKNVGPSARGAGMEIEDAVAVLMAFAEAGRRGGEAGTGLKQILLKLPTKTALKLFKELQITAKDATTGGMRPLADILDDLNKTMGQMDGFKQLEKTVAAMGTRAGPALQLLMEAGGDSIRNFTKIIHENTGMAKRNAEVQRTSLANSFKIVASAADDLRIRLVDVFDPFIRDANERVVSALNFLSKLVVKFGPVVQKHLIEVWENARHRIVTALEFTIGFIQQKLPVIKDVFFNVSRAVASAAAVVGASFASFLGQDALQGMNVGPIERVGVAIETVLLRVEIAFRGFASAFKQTLSTVSVGINALLSGGGGGGLATALWAGGKGTFATGGEDRGSLAKEFERRSGEIAKRAISSGANQSRNAQEIGKQWLQMVSEMFNSIDSSSMGRKLSMAEITTALFGSRPDSANNTGGLAGGGGGAGGTAARALGGTIDTVFGAMKVSGDNQVDILKDIKKLNEKIVRNTGGGSVGNRGPFT